MSAVFDLAEFAKARKKAKRHKRRLASGKVITVEGEAKKPTSSSAIRNLELLARSTRSITYSADTIHRMAARHQRMKIERSKPYLAGKAFRSASREARDWARVGIGAGRLKNAFTNTRISRSRLSLARRLAGFAQDSDPMAVIEFKRKRWSKKRKDEVVGSVKKAVGLAVAGKVAKQAIASGVPRILGVRLERHTTSKKNWHKIEASGGYLDPAYGGGDSGANGAAASLYDPDQVDAFKKNSKGYVHITGTSTKEPEGKIHGSGWKHRIKSTGLGAIAGTPYRKIQTQTYRAFVAKSGEQPKTLFVPGNDKYFDDNFTPDPDEIAAIKTKGKVKVYESREAATIGHLKKRGVKGVLSDMGSNKARVASGLAITGGGLLAAKKIQEIANNGGVVKKHRRKTKRGFAWVKGFRRKKRK